MVVGYKNNHSHNISHLIRARLQALISDFNDYKRDHIIYQPFLFWAKQEILLREGIELQTSSSPLTLRVLCVRLCISLRTRRRWVISMRDDKRYFLWAEQEYERSRNSVAGACVAVCPPSAIGIPTSSTLRKRRRVLCSQTVFDFVSRIASLKKCAYWLKWWWSTTDLIIRSKHVPRPNNLQ